MIFASNCYRYGESQYQYYLHGSWITANNSQPQDKTNNDVDARKGNFFKGLQSHMCVSEIFFPNSYPVFAFTPLSSDGKYR